MKRCACVWAMALALGCSFDPGGEPGSGGVDEPEPPDAPGDPAPPGPAFPCAGEGDAGDGLGGEVRCFPDEIAPEGPPLVAIEYALESYEGQDAVHVRLTFDPGFVDNQYGDGALGWDHRPKGHTFKDLAGSDHADLVLVDAGGAVVFDLSLDYVSEDPSRPCGWGSLGPMGGDGAIRTGDAGDILAWSSSLDRNLNERGYCDYRDASPVTDAACAPNPAAPDWDYRVVYELWVRADAFAPAGFGTAHMDEVHASPSKSGDNTVTVTPRECPDDWCNDPDGCDGGDGGVCDDEGDCATGEFCGEGHCVPIVL